MNVTEIKNHEFCAVFNRNGILCGDCKPDYGRPGYSFMIDCVPCHNVSLWRNILHYVAVGYGPMTIFLIFIVVFTVSVNSAPLHGFIFVCQILTSSLFMALVSDSASGSYVKVAYRSFGTLYGIWNLDFFRSVYAPFCIHPNLNTLVVTSLDYFIAAYPLAIIVVLYILVKLHSRDCRLILVLWKPFRYCLARFRHQLNIGTSLVDAFGTFLSLSYVKILSTAVNLMTPTKVWSSNGVVAYHVYINGTIVFWKNQHLWFALFSICAFMTCNILPLIMILIYSIPKAQVVLRCLPASVCNALYPFMDSILGCYKDGTNNTQNCRYFGVIYYIARLLIWTAVMWTESEYLFSVAAAITVIVGILVAFLQPYKSALYNKVDTILILVMALVMIGVSAFYSAKLADPMNEREPLFFTGLLCFIPLLYIVSYFFYEVVIIRKLPQKYIQNVSRMIRDVYQKLKHTHREINEATGLINSS